MLLIGIKRSFTKNPIKPMTTQPTPVLNATLENSANKHPNPSPSRTK
jgi:hypothetical protein